MFNLKRTLAVLLLALLGLGAVALVLFYQIRYPTSKDDKIQITVEPGESVSQVASKLKEEGLVHSASSFIFYVRLKGLSSSIQAGKYEIPSSLNVVQIVELLQHGTFDVRLTFLEGWRREQYLEYAVENLAADDKPFREEFLKATAGKEGYLFPDTYFVPIDVSASQLVDMLVRTFEERYQSEVAPLQRESGLSKKEMVILASLLERESVGLGEDELETVAGILVKRWRSGWRLDVDATVQYVLGYQEESGEWWVDDSDVIAAGKDINSPYNTYQNKGLPPGPISNPGLAALRAAANFEAGTPWWFYLHDEEGNIHYAITLKEHYKNIEKYLNEGP